MRGPGPAPPRPADRRRCRRPATRPGQSPVSGPRARPARWAAADRGPNRRAAAARPTAVSSVVPVPWASATKRAGDARRPRPARPRAPRGAAPAGRRTAPRRPAPAARERRARAPGSARRPVRRRPCARRAPRTTSAAAGSSVTTTTSATTGQATAAATVSASRASTRSSWPRCRPRPAVSGRSRVLATASRFAGTTTDQLRHAPMSAHRRRSAHPPVRVGAAPGSIMGRITRAGPVGPARKGARGRGERSGAGQAGPRPSRWRTRWPLSSACAWRSSSCTPVASLMFRLRYRHADRLPAARTGPAGGQPRVDPRPARLRPAGVRRRPAPALPGQGVGRSRGSPARSCAAPGRSRWPASRPTRTPRWTRPGPTSTPGNLVVIYPEGSVTRDPDWWPMQARTGVARLALTTDAVVVPVAQWGPQQVHDYHRKKLRLRFRAPGRLPGRRAGRPLRRRGPQLRAGAPAVRRPAAGDDRPDHGPGPRPARRAARGAGAADLPPAAAPRAARRRLRERRMTRAAVLGRRLLGHDVRQGARRRRLRRDAARPPRRSWPRRSPRSARTPTTCPGVRLPAGGAGHRGRRPRRWPAPSIVVLAVPSQSLRGNLDRVGAAAAAGRDPALADEGHRARHDQADERGHLRGRPAPARTGSPSLSGPEPGPGDRRGAAGRDGDRLHRRRAGRRRCRPPATRRTSGRTPTPTWSAASSAGRSRT